MTVHVIVQLKMTDRAAYDLSGSKAGAHGTILLAQGFSPA
jgi:hypothetical protein